MNSFYSNSEYTFSEAWEVCETRIDYNPEWENGTGYLDNAVDLSIEGGGVAFSQTTDGRRILLIGTDFGTIVVFDRYCNDLSTQVCNTPNGIAELCNACNGVNSDTFYQLWNFNSHMKKLLRLKNQETR